MCISTTNTNIISVNPTYMTIVLTVRYPMTTQYCFINGNIFVDAIVQNSSVSCLIPTNDINNTIILSLVSANNAFQSNSISISTCNVTTFLNATVNLFNSSRYLVIDSSLLLPLLDMEIYSFICIFKDAKYSSNILFFNQTASCLLPQNYSVLISTILSNITIVSNSIEYIVYVVGDYSVGTERMLLFNNNINSSTIHLFSAIQYPNGKILIRGYGFQLLSPMDIFCNVSDYMIPVSILSDSEIFCSYNLSISSISVSYPSTVLSIDVHTSAVVSSIHPNICSNQGCVITIVGFNFEDLGDTFCLIGDNNLLPAVYISSFSTSSMFICNIPPHSSRSSFQLVIFTHGYEAFINSTVSSFLIYIEDPIIYRIEPLAIAVNKTVILSIYGANFQSTNQTIYCLLSNNQISISNIVNDTFLSCIVSPSWVPDLVSIRLSYDSSGDYFFESYTVLQFLDNIQLYSVNPRKVSTTGGAILILSGSSFFQASTIECMFDNKITSIGRFIDSNHIECISPPYPSSFDFSYNYSYFSSNTTWSSFLRFETTVSILFDGFSSSSIEIEYVIPPIITGISSLQGSTFGNNVIIINGFGFYGNESDGNEHIVCYFDSILVSAHIQSNSSISCIAPNHSVGSVDFIVYQYGIPCVIDVNISNSSTLVYIYEEAPIIISLSPSISLLHGGDQVTVIGESFDLFEDNELLCSFGNIFVPAIVINSTMIICTIPSSSIATTVPFRLQVVDSEYISLSFDFQYIHSILITDIYPRFGNLLGGNLVRVFGLSFFSSSNIQCHFGSNVSIIGHFINSSLIECFVPWINEINDIDDINDVNSISSSSVVVNFSLSFNEFEVISNLTYEYQAFPIILNIYPLIGFSMETQYIEINGYGFQNQSNIQCLYDDNSDGNNDIVVMAEYLSFRSIRCQRPPLSVGNISLSIQHDNKNIVIINNNTITTLILSNYLENLDYITYQVYETPRVYSIDPNIGFIGSGTQVIIYGNGFDILNNFQVSCRFGNISITAIHMNNTNMMCISPLAVIAETVLLSIEWVIENETYSVGNFVYRYVLPFYVNSVSPNSINIYGGTILSITGSFYSTNSIYCVLISSLSILSIQIVAKVRNPSILECITPDLSSTLLIENDMMTLFLQIHKDNEIYETYQTLSVIQPPSISSVFPLFGMTIGGTNISIVGKNFMNIIFCVFNETNVRAVYVSSSLVYCLSPTHIIGTINLSLVQNDNHNNDSNSINNINNCNYAVYDFNLNEVAIFEYHYIDVPVLKTIYPTIGSIHGNEVITVTGIGFDIYFNFTIIIICSFDHMESPGIFLNSSTILCITRSLSLSSLNTSAIPVLVRLRSSFDSQQTYFSGSAFFRYIDVKPITSLFPSIGSSFGGTKVMITGSFLDVSSVICVFETVGQVEGQFINVTTIACISPLYLFNHIDQSAEITVNVILDGYKIHSTIPFIYESPCRISDVSTLFGSSLISSQISIQGFGFRFENEIICSFNQTKILAKWISSSQIICFTPITIPGYVSLSISQNGILAIDNIDDNNIAIFPFEFFDSPILLSISPMIGLIKGGQFVSVNVLGFHTFYSNVVCQFGNISTPVLDYSDTRLSCITPPLSSSSSLPSTLSSTKTTLIVSLALSSGEVFPGSSIFQYVDTSTIMKLIPSASPILGGTSFIVLGSNFYPTNDCFCLFDSSIHTIGRYVNDTAIECISPPALSNEASIITFTVSLDGILSSNSLPYQYINLPIIYSIFPSQGITSGGTVITIQGELFDSTFSISCSFHDFIVSATLLSNNQISCSSPSYIAGMVPIFIIINGLKVSSNPFYFEYVDTPIVSSISPSFIDTMGNNTIFLHGFGFTNINVLNTSCVFNENNNSNSKSNNKNDVPIEVIFINTSTITCKSPMMKAGKSFLRILFLESLISVVSIDVFAMDSISYYIMEKRVPVAQITTIHFHSSSIFYPYSYSCGLINSSNIPVIVTEYGLECSIYSSKMGKNSIQLFLDNYGMIFQSFIEIVPNPIIHTAYQSVINNRTYITLNTSYTSMGENWIFVFQGFQIKPFRILNSDPIWIGDVSSYRYRHRHYYYYNNQDNLLDTFVFLTNSYGNLISNKMIIVENSTYLINIVGTNVEISNFSHFSKLSYKNTFLNTIAIDTSMNNTIKNLILSFNHSTSKIINRYNLSNDFYFPFQDMNIIRQFLFQPKNIIIADSKVCRINNRESCLQDRSTFIQNIAVQNSMISLINSSKFMVVDRVSYPFDLISTPKVLVIEKIEPMIILTKNGTWITITGRYFRQSTGCEMSYPKQIAFHSVIITSKILQCYIPSKQQLRLNTSTIYLIVTDKILQITSENSMPLFYDDEYGTIQFNPQYLPPIFDPSQSNVLSSSNPFNSLNDKNYCNWINDLMDLKEDFYFRNARNFFFYSMINRTYSMNSPCSSFHSFFQSNTENISVDQTIRSIVIQPISTSTLMSTSLSNSKSYSMLMIFLLSPTIIYLNQSETNIIYFLIYNLPTFDHITLIAGSDINVGCINKESNIYGCPLSNNCLSPGLLSIMIYSKNVGNILNTTLDIRLDSILFSNHSMDVTRTVSSLPSILDVRLSISNVRPLLSFSNGNYSIILSGNQLNKISGCRLLFRNSDNNNDDSGNSNNNNNNYFMMIQTNVMDSMNDQVSCFFQNIGLVGIAELEIQNSYSSSWISTYYSIRLVNRPILLLAMDSISFNSTISIYGKYFPSYSSILCRLQFQDQFNITVPGTVLSESRCDCTMFDTKSSIYFLVRISISFNQLDYFDVPLQRLPDISRLGFESTSVTASVDVLISNDSMITDISNSISSYLSSQLSMIQISRVCDISTFVTIQIIGENDVSSIGYCNIYTNNTLLQVSMIQWQPNNKVRCEIPIFPPGFYTIRVDYENTMNMVNMVNTVAVEFIELYCIPRPVINSIQLLPISSFDSSSVFKIQGIGFQQSLPITCVFNYQVVVVSIDTYDQILCSFNFLLPKCYSQFIIMSETLVLYQIVDICLTESMIIYGNHNISDSRSNDNIDSYYNSSFIIKNILPIVSSLPKVGQTIGGLVVEIVIENLDISTSYTCQFSEINVMAEVVDFNKIICISPPSKPRNVSLSVISNNNNNNNNNEGNYWCCSWFVYYPKPVIFGTLPSYVLSDGNGGSIGNGYSNNNNYNNNYNSNNNIIYLNVTYIVKSLVVDLYCYINHLDKIRASFVYSNHTSPYSTLSCSLPNLLIGNSIDVAIGSKFEIWSNTVIFPVISTSGLILSIFPKYGSYLGSTTVIVKLPQKLPIDNVSCVFGSMVAIQSYYNDSSLEIRCITPLSMIGLTTLFIFDSSSFYNPMILAGYYFFEAPADIVDASPSILTVNVSTDILVSGIHFRDSSMLSCILNGQYIPAKWLSRSRILCTVQFHQYYTSDSTIILQVSNNGIDLSSRNVSLTLVGYQPMVIVYPLQGYTIGGTPITLSFIYLTITGSIQCRFGDVISKSYFINSTQSICISPFLSSGVSDFTILHDHREIWTGYYRFTDIPIITTISTNNLFIGCNQSIYIYGSQFDSNTIGYISKQQVCQYQNSTCLFCNVMIPSNFTASQVFLDLSINNGIDFINHVITFNVIPLLQIISVSPSFLFSTDEIDINISTTDSTSMEFPLICGFIYDNRIYYTQAYQLSFTSFVCQRPPYPLKIGDTVILQFYQNNQLLMDDDINLNVLSNPLLISSRPTSIIVGMTTPVYFTFLESFPSIDLSCILNDSIFPIIMTDKTNAICYVHILYPGSMNLQVKINSIFKSSIIYESQVSVFVLPNDISVNVTGLVMMTKTVISISSKSCMIPNTIVTCQSLSTYSITTLSYNRCEVLCEVVISNTIVSSSTMTTIIFDIGLCMNDPDCFSYTLIDSIPIYSLSPIVSMHPTIGPVTGNTTVIIYGIDFSGILYCSFGGILSPAIILSSSKLSCISPRNILPRNISVSIVNQNVDVSGPYRFYFEYLPIMATPDVMPKILSAKGQTELNIFFPPSFVYEDDMLFNCRFNDYIVNAIIVEYDQISCISPQLFYLDTVQFYVQVNDVDFSEPISLLVISPPTVLFIDPLNIVSGYDSYNFTIITDDSLLSTSSISTTNLSKNIDRSNLWLCQLDNIIIPMDVEENILTCIYSDVILNEGIHTLSLFFANALLNSYTISSYRPSIVTYISPLAGFIGSSTVITMNLQYQTSIMTYNLTTCCFDNGLVSPVSILSSNQIQCAVPFQYSMLPISSSSSIVDSNSINIKIGLQGVDLNCGYSNFIFTYIKVPTIIAVSSTKGPFFGGDPIDIMFASDFSFSMIYCRIGEESFIGQIYGHNSILCVTRKSYPQRVDIEISVNNIDFIPTGYQYEYQSLVPLENSIPLPSIQPIISRIDPMMLSSGQIQTIRVYGQHFQFGCQCILGNQYAIRTTYLSTYELICLLPEHTLGTDTLTVNNPGGNRSDVMIIQYQLSASVYITPGNSVNPSFGPLLKETLITIFGNNLNLISTTQVLCYIGNSWVYAFEVTSTSVKCITPTTIVSGKVSIKLANSNRDFISGYATFEYIDDPIVYGGNPAQGYANSQIILRGRGFLRLPSLTCLLGENSCQTSVLSDTQILCIVPNNLVNDSYNIALQTNGQHYIRTGIYFDYLLPLSIDSMWPYHGPAVRGNTIVTIYGNYFPNTIDIYCIFGSSRVSAIVISSTYLQCRTPSHIPSTVNVSVVSDGILTTRNSNLQFSFLPDVSVDKIIPDHGYTAGGYVVIVFGSNFINSTSLGCIFGDMKSRGYFLSSVSILCFAPSPLGKPAYKNYNLVPVEVTNNGYDYSNSNVTFRYNQPCDSGFFCLGSSPFLCPNGTSCPINSRNFTLCSPGYFQPLQGQSSCIPCPIGYICPDSGMSRPVVCPIGQICDIFSLRSSQKSCPNGFYCLNATKSSSTLSFEEASYHYGNQTTWILNEITGVISFNSSVLDYSYKPWPYPAYGQSRIINPPNPSCDGYDCIPGSTNVLAEAPFPCPLGYYCRTGVGSEIPIPKNFSTPQRCFDGFFCPRGSKSPEGSGPCPNGYFCPTQVDAITCPPGHYCPGVGNTAPVECYPGTYNPYEGQANCTVCPTGHICPGWGSLLPEPCPAGFVCTQLGLSFPVILCPQGYYCEEGTLTLDPSDPTKYKPIPCPDRVFCLGGVANLISIEWIATQPYGANRPQICSEGTYCEAGSYQSSGTGLCFLGHYCPPNSSFPIATPIGNFASTVGSIAPTLCYPGTYAPLVAQIDCLPCPSGYTCQSYGTYQPTLCTAGTYRAQVDAVVCVSCPQGTYGYEVGAPDISLCLPCPPGLVCGKTAINNLNTSTPCAAGYVCGHATQLLEQYSHQSPAGYFSSTNTIPQDEYNNRCSGGYYCARGTANYLSYAAKCEIGSYCPPATSIGTSVDNLCPQLTTSAIGSIGIQNCSIESVNVCDKIEIEPFIPFQDVTYAATFSYILIDGSGTNATFNSSLQSTATYKGEVQTVRKIMPINFTSSSDLWINDTIEVFRSCPTYGSSIGENLVTIIGRNFINTSSNYCKFRPCISANRGISLRRCRNQLKDLSGNDLPKAGLLSNVTYITPAIYLSPTRVQCKIPEFFFDNTKFHPTFSINSYTCDYLLSGKYSYNSTGNYSYIRPCDSLTTISCINLPEVGYEYFTSITIACTTTEIGLGVCPNRPDINYLFNPCITSEILIEVANDGEHYSGGQNVNGTFILSTVRYGDGNKIYRNYKNYTTNATFAEYTYVRSDYYYTNPAIVEMDTHACLIARYSEEALRQREQGWFLLQAHSVAHIMVDLSHMGTSPNLIYGQDYRISVFMIPSRCDINLCSSNRIQLQPSEYLPCQYPRDFSNWFLNAGTYNIQNNLTVYALDDLLIKVEVHILYGLYAPYDHLFENTTTVRIQSPQRAKSFSGLSESDTETRPLTPYVSYERKLILEQYIFCAVYDLSFTSSIAQSLNLPPVYQNYERGRALMMYNLSIDNPYGNLYIDDFNIVQEGNVWNQPATTVDETKELLDAYFETFQQTSYDPSSGYTFSTNELLLPYLPYFSNCYNFDSYIPIWLLVEGKECILPDTYPTYWYRYKYPALVDEDQIKIVGPFDFLQYPVADWCERNLTCNYEEQLSSSGGTSRWFEQTTATSLFQILRYPVNYYEYTGRKYTDSPSQNDDGGGVVIDKYLARSVDNFIPVTYDHTAGDVISGCVSNCFGREYTLEITYYQVDKNSKKIIYATLIGNNYDFNATNTEYTLKISYFALGWLDLILNFAYDYTVNSVLNVIIGLTLIACSGLIWLVNRLTTHLRSPPEFRFVGIYVLFFPPILAGSILALIPIWLLTAFGNYVIFGTFTTDPQNPQQVSVGLILDTFPSTYNALGYAISDSSALALRNQRVGTMFCIIGFCCFISASKLYFCKPETKRERDIAKLRTTLAHRLWQWQPVLWKKSNFIFTSFCVALLLVMLVEVSLWSAFSNYQFLCMTIIAIIGIVFDKLFFLQMQDELLAAPLNAAYGFIGQFVTFGANNYLQFILSYVYGIILAIFVRLYLDTYLNIFYVFGYYCLDESIKFMRYIIPRYVYDKNRFIMKILKNRDRAKVKRRYIKDLINSDPSYIDIHNTDNPTYDEQIEAVEPLIGNYSNICNDMICVCYFPYMIYLMMQYRVQTGIPTSYGIRQSDMVIYLVFQGFMVIFEPLYAAFNIATLELYRGWKCYDYLIYCRYRFLQRESRWKGMEDSVDESIDESVRKLDQMCFSSQYFFMLMLMSNGIIYNILAVEVWLHSPGGSPAQYSPFSDSGFVLLLLIMLSMWVCVEQGCYYIAYYTDLWKVKHTNTDWHINYKDVDGLNIPEWGDIQGASHDAYLMNQRITSETFRYKFLNYNRTWLIHQLPQILTPRTLQRSRPSLINQLQRVINAYRQDISDQSEDEPLERKFGRVILSNSSRNVIKWWISKARRRMKLKKVVDPLIRKARGYQCEICLSVRQLQVEYDIDIDKMSEMYDREYPRGGNNKNNDDGDGNSDDDGDNDDNGGGGGNVIDSTQWRNFWTKYQSYHTICLPCLARRRDDLRSGNIHDIGKAIYGVPITQSIYDKNNKNRENENEEDDTYGMGGRRDGFGPISLSIPSKAMLLNWYRKAQLNRQARLARRRKNRELVEISDDEDDQFRAPWAQEILKLTPATTDIAMHWLKKARQAIYRKTESVESGARSESGKSSKKYQAAEGLLPGMRSKYLRK